MALKFRSGEHATWLKRGRWGHAITVHPVIILRLVGPERVRIQLPNGRHTIVKTGSLLEPRNLDNFYLAATEIKNPKGEMR